MINEELISAYLDGELTAQEQAQVEQALAGDVRLQRMHDDLRALRSSLQSLPQQKLDAGFAQRVMLAAQRARAEQSATTDRLVETLRAPEVLVATHHGQETTVERAQHEPVAWRVVVWSVAGLAAVLMVALFAPQSSEIAQLPQNKPDKKVAVLQPAAAPEEAAKSVAKMQAPPVGEFANRNETNQLRKAETLQGAAPEAKQGLPQDAGRKDATDAALGGHRAKMAEATEAQEQDAAATLPGAAAAARAPLRDEAPAFGGAGKTGAMLMRRNSMAARQLKTLATESDQVVVVRLKMSKEAKARSSIDEVLAKQAIVMRGTELRSRSANGIEEKASAAADTKRASDGVDKASEVRVEAVRKHLKDAGQTLAANDVVYVEASAEQIDAAIAELEAQPGTQLAFATLDENLARKPEMERLAAPSPGAVPGAPPRPSETLKEGSGGGPGNGGGNNAATTARGFAAPPAADTAKFEAGEVHKPQALSDGAGRAAGVDQNGLGGFAERLATNELKTAVSTDRALEREQAADKVSGKKADLSGAVADPQIEAQVAPANIANDAAVESPSKKRADAAPRRIRVVFVIEGE